MYTIDINLSEPNCQMRMKLGCVPPDGRLYPEFLTHGAQIQSPEYGVVAEYQNDFTKGTVGLDGTFSHYLDATYNISDATPKDAFFIHNIVHTAAIGIGGFEFSGTTHYPEGELASAIFGKMKLFFSQCPWHLNLQLSTLMDVLTGVSFVKVVQTKTFHHWLGSPLWTKTLSASWRM